MYKSAMSFLILVLIIVLSTIVSSDEKTKYSPAIFSFGDSILDAGNNRFLKNSTIRADFPPYGSSYFPNPTGRFTNGRTVPDFISQFLGIDFQKPYMESNAGVLSGSLKSYPSNGVNFASGGSGVLPGTETAELGVIPLEEQLQQFQTMVLQNQIDLSLIQKSLFFFESGSNDIFNFFESPEETRVDPEEHVELMLSQVKKFVRRIYSLGARRIVLLSLPPVGCAPGRAMLQDSPINRCDDHMNVMVKRYNFGLHELAKHVEFLYPGSLGTYGAIYDILKFQINIGFFSEFSEVKTACCGGGSLGGERQCGVRGYTRCEKPDEFLYWDSFNPTQRAYELIANDLWNGWLANIRPYNLITLADLQLFPAA